MRETPYSPRAGATAVALGRLPADRRGFGARVGPRRRRDRPAVVPITQPRDGCRVPAVGCRFARSCTSSGRTRPRRGCGRAPRARRRCLLTSGHEDAEQSRAPAVRRRSAWSTSIDVRHGRHGQIKHSLAPRGTRACVSSGAGMFCCGSDWTGSGATSSRWLPQRSSTEAALILLEHHGAVRRRVAIVCVGGSGSAMTSAALRAGRGGSNVWIAQSSALHVPPRVTRRGGTARGLGRAGAGRAQTNVVPEPLSFEDVGTGGSLNTWRRLPIAR